MGIKTDAAALAARVIRKYSGKDKKGVPQSAIKKFAGEHGEAAAVKGFGKARVDRTKTVMDKKAEAKKASRPAEDKRPAALSGEKNTPTSRKKAPKRTKRKEKIKVVKSKDKSSESKTLRKAMRSRDEEGRKSFTTKVGKGVGTKPKLDKKKKKEAQKQANKRETYEDFEARLSGMAHQGGVSGTGKGPVLRSGTAFGSGDPKHGLTGDGQAQDFMHGSRDARVDPDDYFDKPTERMSGGKVSIQQRGWGKARKR